MILLCEDALCHHTDSFPIDVSTRLTVVFQNIEVKQPTRLGSICLWYPKGWENPILMCKHLI